MRRTFFRGIRWRTSAAATLSVAVFLAVAAIAFTVAQRHQLEASITETAQQQAADVSMQVARAGVEANLTAGTGDQSLIQIVDPSGRVVAASPSVGTQTPLVSGRPLPGDTTIVRSRALPIGEEDEFVVVAVGVTSPDGPVVVLVAESLELVAQSTNVMVTLLLIGFPIVVLGVAGASYWLAGRALAPVEAIRARVAGVEGTNQLGARVPVPDGDDDIARLARTMNAMLGRLQVASDQQQRFVADASHELRSPLATIRAAHEIGALHPGSRDCIETSQDVLAELDRVDHLVEDLLVLARADEHGLRAGIVDVDLDDLVETEARRLGKLEGGLLVTVDGPPVRVRGNPAHLARVLRNLADNAVQHTNSRIDFRLRVAEDAVTVEVEDDGPGIPEEDRERVFERFVRLDESRTRSSGGTGLGLAIAREITIAHQGGLHVEPGLRGACFVWVLPTT